MKKPMREGFWYSENEPDLPFPQAAAIVWDGRGKFVTALDKIEAKAKRNHYRGFSTCRLCHEPNGSVEYAYKEWVWPIGFRHYISHHDIRPSLAFEEFILREYKLLKKKGKKNDKKPPKQVPAYRNGRTKSKKVR